MSKTFMASSYEMKFISQSQHMQSTCTMFRKKSTKLYSRSPRLEPVNTWLECILPNHALSARPKDWKRLKKLKEQRRGRKIITLHMQMLFRGKVQTFVNPNKCGKQKAESEQQYNSVMSVSWRQTSNIFLAYSALRVYIYPQLLYC